MDGSLSGPPRQFSQAIHIKIAGATTETTDRSSFWCWSMARFGPKSSSTTAVFSKENPRFGCNASVRATSTDYSIDGTFEPKINPRISHNGQKWGGQTILIKLFEIDSIEGGRSRFREQPFC